MPIEHCQPKLAGQIADVFSHKELALLASALGKVPDQTQTDRQIYTNGFTSGDVIYPFVKRLVIDRINQLDVPRADTLTVGMLLKAQEPFAIHSDSPNKGDNGKGTAYLIPLHMQRDPGVDHSVKSHTIVFEQQWESTGLVTDFIASERARILENNAKPIWHMIPEPHRHTNYYEYLSVALLAPWHLGSLIYWDRSLLHCSDEFRQLGIREKQALVLFYNAGG